ncbi:MAG: DNA-3-methyladenine glycosylase 2 family protein [Thaumarchaeota archaeon]|nr:DNA-3-methyladenine glycosylase 2 family protein [Nitrososphaerota archaeon]
MRQHDGVRFLRRDPVMRGIIASVGEYKLRRRNRYFAVLVESIISQQLATRAAEAIFKKFCGLYPRFPTATEILATRRSVLRRAGLSGMKVEYLKDLSRRVDSGQVRLERLPRMTDGEVVAHLTQVKGIGRWTAEMFLIFSLCREDVLPVQDLGLQKGVQRAFSLPRLPTPKEVEELADRWRPYRTVATWYLWKSLQKFDRIG